MLYNNWAWRSCETYFLKDFDYSNLRADFESHVQICPSVHLSTLLLHLSVSTPRVNYSIYEQYASLYVSRLLLLQNVININTPIRTLMTGHQDQQNRTHQRPVTIGTNSQRGKEKKTERWRHKEKERCKQKTEKVGKREKARHYQSHEDREGVGRWAQRAMTVSCALIYNMCRQWLWDRETAIKNADLWKTSFCSAKDGRSWSIFARPLGNGLAII